MAVMSKVETYLDVDVSSAGAERLSLSLSITICGFQSEESQPRKNVLA